ncbi:AraC-like DNA-binding protein [Nocardia transvalensis]|uniref:AraC-like DNA-binding protein n=1 Tax=Nocardia transvalensis TaxID=37333 RepID=A0A7W9PHU3_9NOCA|nr:AraC family transcriptional regulator [Nocardia transvalensis]MBB5916347.1 AraC-like DNA-binding protein [Nocardia transvalensis]
MRSAGTVRAATDVWDIAVPAPADRLAGVSMAGFRGRDGALVDIRVVPYPALTVFLDFGDGQLVDDTGGTDIRGGIVSGLTPGGLRGRGRRIDCLQVRLSPLLAHTVLGAADFGTATVPLGDLWGRDADRTHERLHAARSWDDRFAIAADALARRSATGRAVDPEVAFAWRRIVHSHGRIRVERLADEAGWSRKRLWSRFRAQLGVTPKRAAGLVRFDHAAHRLAAGANPAAVAAESGYTDQSHLHRDVRAFAGVTPTAVAAAPWLAVDDVAWPAPR